MNDTLTNTETIHPNQDKIGSVSFRFARTNRAWRFEATSPKDGKNYVVFHKCPKGRETATRVAKVLSDSFDKTGAFNTARGNVNRLLQYAS